MGETVYAQNYSEGPRWVEAVVIKITGPVSYVAQPVGGTFCRHIDQLRQRFPRNADCVPGGASESGVTEDQIPEADLREGDRSTQMGDVEEPFESPSSEPLAVTGEDGPEAVTEEGGSPPGVEVAEQAPVRRSSRVRTRPKYLDDFIHALLCSYLRGGGV